MTAVAGKVGTTLSWTVKSLALWYACVVLFSYSFMLREALLRHFDKEVVDNLAIGVVGASVLFISLWVVRNHRVLLKKRSTAVCVGLSIMAALMGLVSVDPQFPAKRIHVVEYFVLAGLVFSAFKLTRHIGARAVMALVVASMLGGLDEMLQGMMSQRTYGFVDVMTNAYGALSGVFAVCAVHFYKGRDWQESPYRFIDLSAPLALAVGYFLFLAALYPFGGLNFPLWVLLPVAGGLVVVTNSLFTQVLDEDMQRFHIAVTIIAATALGGMVYVQIMAIHFI